MASCTTIECCQWSYTYVQESKASAMLDTAIILADSEAKSGPFIHSGTNETKGDYVPHGSSVCTTVNEDLCKKGQKNQ